MNIIFKLLFSFLCVLTMKAQNSVSEDLAYISKITNFLDTHGIKGFVSECKQQTWQVPHIPSKWHTDHVSKSEQKPVDVAARKFGEKLAQLLDQEALKLQKLVIGDTLYGETLLLLNLSDWCATTEGYGNVLLAQRSLDISTIGVARLTANMEFSIEGINVLLERLQPSWLSVKTSQAILNKDAGANIFTQADRTDIQKTWGAGRVIRRMMLNSEKKADIEKRGYDEILQRSPEIENNLSYFEEIEIGKVGSITLTNLWNQKCHLYIVNGLELQNVEKVKALAEFRRVIQNFPEKPIFTEAELREREQSKALSEKHGLVVTNMEDTYSSPMAAAFAQAWKKYIDSQPKNPANHQQQRYSLDARAFQAYDEVKRGIFFDKDTLSIQQFGAR